jgi:3-hydroxyisobutyrate dehydrogenase-like beta-hydroxyacid dehydrogenase
MSKSRIGFIGAGLMGHGMAKHMLGAGYPLTTMANRNREPIEDLIRRGASEAKTPAEVAQASDIVFLCLTDSKTVEAVVRGPQGLAKGARKGLIVVDCTSADPVSTEALTKELAEIGVTLCDSPLNGTPVQAAEGKLSAMIGADKQTFQTILPVVKTWAAKIEHLGPVGTGHKMKLLNNFIAQGYGALYAEALVLGRKIGVPPEVFMRVMGGSRMDCGYFQTFFGYAHGGNRESHKFTIANALKDLRYVEGLAQAAHMANPVGNAVKNAYSLAMAKGRGDDFVPTVVDTIAEANGLSPFHPRDSA